MYQIDDEVEIAYGDEWLPAKVIRLYVPAAEGPAISQNCLDGVCTCCRGDDYTEVVTERWGFARFRRRNEAIRPRTLQEV